MSSDVVSSEYLEPAYRQATVHDAADFVVHAVNDWKATTSSHLKEKFHHMKEKLSHAVESVAYSGAAFCHGFANEDNVNMVEHVEAILEDSSDRNIILAYYHPGERKEGMIALGRSIRCLKENFLNQRSGTAASCAPDRSAINPLQDATDDHASKDDVNLENIEALIVENGKITLAYRKQEIDEGLVCVPRQYSGVMVSEEEKNGIELSVVDDEDLVAQNVEALLEGGGNITLAFYQPEEQKEKEDIGVDSLGTAYKLSCLVDKAAVQVIAGAIKGMNTLNA